MMGMDIKGQQYGSLTAIEYRGALQRGKDYRWRVRCLCQTEFEVNLSDLIKGRYRSCAQLYSRVCPAEVAAAKASLPTTREQLPNDELERQHHRDMQARNANYDYNPYTGQYTPKRGA